MVHAHAVERLSRPQSFRSCPRQPALPTQRRPALRIVSRLQTLDNLHFEPKILSSTSIDSSRLVKLQYYKRFTAGRRSVQKPEHPALVPEVEIIDCAEALPRASLEALFAEVSFRMESVDVMWERLHAKACRMVWARYTEGDLHWPSTPTAVGTAFAILDGHGRATIWNVCTHPDWQGRGLGSALIERLLYRLEHEDGIHQVALCSGPATVPFYARLGFHPNPDVDVFI